MKQLFYAFTLAMVVLACGQNGNSSSQTATEEPAASVLETKSNRYTLTSMSESPAFEDAALTAYEYVDGQWTFTVEGDTYALGTQTPDAANKGCANSAKGQHIHLIVDNKPYSAQYTNAFEYPLEDGEHHFLAFLSRSYHESLKHPAAAIAKKIRVENGNITAASDVAEPALYYSRPKGSYIGDDTKNVMLDFYVKNVELGTKHFIKAQINDETHILKEWKPMIINGLPMGENTITLELLDENMAPIATDLTPVTRTFTLKELPDPAG